jgi:hypothetical protein
MRRRNEETPEEEEARVARAEAEAAARESAAQWHEVNGIAELVREIHSGRNGVSFLEDLAEAMKPRKKRKP